MVTVALPSAIPVTVTTLPWALTEAFPASEDVAVTFTTEAALTTVAVMFTDVWVYTVRAFLSSRITISPLMVTVSTAFPAVSALPSL
jgi:hypothetical protein